MERGTRKEILISLRYYYVCGITQKHNLAASKLFRARNALNEKREDGEGGRE